MVKPVRYNETLRTFTSKRKDSELVPVDRGQPRPRNEKDDPLSFSPFSKPLNIPNFKTQIRHRVVTRSYFRNFLIFPWLFLTKFDKFFRGPPVELRKKFENTSVSVYRRCGVSITTKGQFLIYLGQNRKFYWFCRRFPRLFLTFHTDYFFLLTFSWPWLSWRVTSLRQNATLIPADKIIFPQHAEFYKTSKVWAHVRWSYRAISTRISKITSFMKIYPFWVVLDLTG